MQKPKPFTAQLIIIGGFILFFYVFFALATQIYRDYRLEKHIGEFEGRIKELAQLARQKPKDVDYFSSPEYKDRYAKENLNLLNPGERVIVIPEEEQNVVKGETLDPQAAFASSSLLALPPQIQWWEYFFGETLSLKVSPIEKKQEAKPPSDLPEMPEESKT